MTKKVPLYMYFRQSQQLKEEKPIQTWENMNPWKK